MKLSEKSVASPKKGMTKQFVLLMALCLVGVGWLFTHYHKNQKRIVRYQQEIKDLKKQQQALLKTRAANSQLEQAIKQLKMTLRSPGKPFVTQTTKRTTPHMITVAKKAQHVGLDLNSCVVQKRKNKNWFEKQNVLYETTGTRKQIWHFIEELQNNKYALRCKRLALTKAANRKNTNFSCTLQFLTFRTKPSISTA